MLSPAPLPAADQPQWGHRWTRSLVSDERGLPDSFDPATGRNIRWTAKRGADAPPQTLAPGPLSGHKKTADFYAADFRWWTLLDSNQ